VIDRHLIQLPPQRRPILSVVIHTEEEFDWNSQFDRTATGVAHARHLHRAQDIFDDFGVRPTYVVDYPIASQQEAVGPLKAFADEGRAEIGAHLHPWVSPPYTEELNQRNSYPGNLSPDLEQAKLERLTETIAQAFGSAPRSYLAGRYGLGPDTAEILDRLGYRVDISPAPPIDFRADTGPDYSGFSNHPYWFGPGNRLLGLPGTGAFVGILRRLGRPLYPRITHQALRWARLPGILSRLRLLERIRLSPEGYLLAEQRRLTKSLLQQGIRIFVFSFHSPSVHPGYTPYVRTEGDLQTFLDCVRGYLEFFMGELGGISMTATEVREEVCRMRNAECGIERRSHDD